MEYQVKRVDKRFGLVDIAIQSADLIGKITAFIRPAPVRQKQFEAIKDMVGAHDFCEQRALVIGGTRGLGEVTCKLLTAGGADVKFTYFRGIEDAKLLTGEIEFNGGVIECLLYDVLNPDSDIRDNIEESWMPTHLYYFATPYIAIGNNRQFSELTFLDFCNYYLFGFQRIIREISSPELKGIFYPSTVFIDEVPNGMGEYTTAKMAGEMLCSFLQKTLKEAIIYKPRLPKTRTDQTASLIGSTGHEPAALMLYHLRKLKHSIDTKEYSVSGNG